MITSLTRLLILHFLYHLITNMKCKTIPTAAKNDVITVIVYTHNECMYVIIMNQCNDTHRCTDGLICRA